MRSNFRSLKTRHKDSLGRQSGVQTSLVQEAVLETRVSLHFDYSPQALLGVQFLSDIS